MEELPAATSPWRLLLSLLGYIVFGWIAIRELRADSSSILSWCLLGIMTMLVLVTVVDIVRTRRRRSQTADGLPPY
jgi:uncharacterized membrane protein SirB2